MSKINIQDQLLYQARRERTPIKIFLLRGLQLVGRISAYDMYSVLLESQGRLQLIFKHAISTIEFPEKLKVAPHDGDRPARSSGPRSAGPSSGGRSSDGPPPPSSSGPDSDGDMDQDDEG